MKRERLFLREKPSSILLTVRKSKEPMYSATIAKEAGITYAHTFNVLSQLEELGLINFERIGRIKLVELTEAGEKVADTLKTLVATMELAGIKKRIEETYRRKVQDKQLAEADRAKLSKNLESLKRELERFVNRESGVKELAGKILNRIQQILAEIGKSERGKSADQSLDAGDL